VAFQVFCWLSPSRCPLIMRVCVRVAVESLNHIVLPMWNLRPESVNTLFNGKQSGLKPTCCNRGSTSAKCDVWHALNLGQLTGACIKGYSPSVVLLGGGGHFKGWDLEEVFRSLSRCSWPRLWNPGLFLSLCHVLPPCYTASSRTETSKTVSQNKPFLFISLFSQVFVIVTKAE
jgi:hypothetical protein